MAEAPERGALVRDAQKRARADYGAAIGRHRQELATPALILDLPAARGNIERMAELMQAMPAALRPHVKVHKSPELARLQVAAGAIGVSTATVWEAIVMVDAGIDRVLVVNTIAGEQKLAALAALARHADIAVAVDDVGNAAALSAAARAAGSELGVLIEVDTGMDRAGVRSPEQAVRVAIGASDLPGLGLLGVTGYEGHCSLTPDRELRHRRQRDAMDVLVGAAEAIRATGLPCPIVSAGGTATWEWTAADPRVTEIQAGSYVLMDNIHRAMAKGFEQALTVLTTVISRPHGRVIVDAGSKSIGAPEATTVEGHVLSVVRFDEEHGVFSALSNERVRVGDVVELVPGYAPSTVNWYDVYHVVEDDLVADIWPVLPRGPGHGGLLAR